MNIPETMMKLWGKKCPTCGASLSVRFQEEMINAMLAVAVKKAGEGDE